MAAKESFDERHSLWSAAKAWDVESESIAAINARIHDNVAIEQLEERADNYFEHSRTLFPKALHWNFSQVLEIGSGVGFMLEAIEKRTRHNKNRAIRGLDISESMIAKARERLAGNPHYRSGEIDFLAYDGTRIPQPDHSCDFVYSFATLQHIPKPFVYNLFYEIKRVLAPGKNAILHMPSFAVLPEQEKHFPWRREVEQQTGMVPGSHLHHYYSREELAAVLKMTGFARVDIANGYYVCVRA
jgi:ubiquinone/menaquinone biosynthesis C-methylase UbiE